MDINVGRTLNLLQAALASRVATFVYCSSVSAVGDFHQEWAMVAMTLPFRVRPNLDTLHLRRPDPRDKRYGSGRGSDLSPRSCWN